MFLAVGASRMIDHSLIIDGSHSTGGDPVWLVVTRRPLIPAQEFSLCISLWLASDKNGDQRMNEGRREESKYYL